MLIAQAIKSNLILHNLEKVVLKNENDDVDLKKNQILKIILLEFDDFFIDGRAK